MLWWIVQNLVIVTVLIGAVALTCRIRGVSPAARHALWLVVLVKLVTPPLVVWPWGIPDPLRSPDGRSSADAAAEDPDALGAEQPRPAEEPGRGNRIRGRS